MNTPNKLTVLRVIMIPVFLVFLLNQSIPHNYLWALIVFSAASLTDMLDGHLARKNNLITDFGKFMDPLADKLLVTSALICFIELNLVSSIVVVIIVAREFLVTSLRLVASSSGKVIAADIYGKIKTVAQLIAIIAIMLLQELLHVGFITDTNIVAIIGSVMMWIVAALTVISGANYLWKNRSFVNTTK